MRGIFKQLANGVSQVHDSNLVHRDLKHMNILLSDASLNPKVKIADFGLCQKLQPNSQFTPHSKRVGTAAYMAPEVVQEASCSQMVDIWSLGVILYSLICGRLPFDAADNETVYSRILVQPLVFDQHVAWSKTSDACR